MVGGGGGVTVLKSSRLLEEAGPAGTLCLSARQREGRKFPSI